MCFVRSLCLYVDEHLDTCVSVCMDVQVREKSNKSLRMGPFLCKSVYVGVSMCVCVRECLCLLE